jgi:hypothetical protein
MFWIARGFQKQEEEMLVVTPAKNAKIYGEKDIHR